LRQFHDATNGKFKILMGRAIPADNDCAAKFFVNFVGSIRISYALSNAIERNVNAGGAHGPSPLSGLAI